MANQPDKQQDPFALLMNMRDGGLTNQAIISSSLLDTAESYMNEIALNQIDSNDEHDEDEEEEEEVLSDSDLDAGTSKKRKKGQKGKKKTAAKKPKKPTKSSKQKPKKSSKYIRAVIPKINEVWTFEEQQENEEPAEIDLRSIYKTYGINPAEATRKKPFRKQSNDITNFSIGEARFKFAHRKFDEAIGLLFQVIRMNPQNTEAYDTLGEIYSEMGNYPKALEFYLLAIEFNQNDPHRWIQLAETAVLCGHNKSAVDFYTRAIKLSPKTLTTYYKKCSLLEQMKQYENAFKTYEKLLTALNLESTETDYKIIMSIVFRIANIYNLRMNKPLEALEMVETFLADNSIESEPERFEGFAKLYMDTYLDLLLKNGQHMKVLIKFFQYNFIKIDSNSLPQSDEDVNEDVLIETITTNPDSIQFQPEWVNLILKSKFICVFIYLRKVPFIELHLPEFESLTDPSMQEAVYPALLEAFTQTEMFDKAYAYATKLVQLNDASSRYQYWYGLCIGKIHSEGELEPAIEAFEKAIRLDGHNYDAVNELSRICNLIGNPERALDNVNRLERSHAVIDFKLIYNRCNLLFICHRWDEFVTSSHLLLSSEMYFFNDFTDIVDIIHPNMCLSSLVRMSKRLYRRYAKRNVPTKLSGGKLTGEQLFDLWKKSIFVMLNYTKQYEEAIRWAFSALLCNHFERFYVPFTVCMFRCCLDAKSQPYTYELVRFLIKEHPTSGRLWYAFSVTMNDIYQDFRHKRFCMRIWKSNPNNVNILLMNGHIALLNGRYRHALAIFLLVYRLRSNYRYDSFYIGLCYLHLMMQNHTLDKCSLFAQMLAFFDDYIQKIGKCQESYYNLGRVYHQLGFFRHAIELYTVALHTPLKIHDKRFDLTPEIAFNLSQVYRKSGDHCRANQLIAQFCTI